MIHHLLNILIGLFMGAADVVPGVSGGTVALLTGIYERLIRAISSFDRTLISMLRKRQIRQALDHVDWQFLLPLGLGLATGFIITVKSLAYYLKIDSTRTLILAAFFGMIVAATIVVGRLIGRLKDGKSTANLAMASVGVVLSVSIYFLQANRGGVNHDPSYWYLFFAGAIGICAMILPGISGALILVLLGIYEPLVERVKAFLSFENFVENFFVCTCFGLGAVTGLMLFSRILRRLLDRHAAPTLSLLCGLMVGSLPFVWPFQINTTPGVESLKERIYEPVLPDAFDGDFIRHVAVATIALLFVLVVETIGNRFDSGASKDD